MAGKQVSGDGIPASIAGMSKNQLYDIMSQMKTLIEQNKEQARQILIQNPALTRALFQAQIMLGMVQPPQASPPTSSTASQNLQQSPTLNQQSNIQASSFPGAIGQTQMRKQPSQSMAPIPQSQPTLSPTPPPQPMPSHPLKPIQQPKGHLGSQSTPMSMPQSSQVPNLTQLPQHTASQQPPLHQPPMPSQPMQNTSSQYMPLQPPVQPPLPPQPRPQMQGFPHQGHGQMGLGMGFQQPSGPQMHHSQHMYHSGAKPPAGLPPFSQGQMHLPSQHVPPSLYQGGSPHMGMDFNQVGSSKQTERGPNWTPGIPENPLGQLQGPPSFGGQPGPSNQPPRPAAPLTPELEKALLQQVMSLTPEQINMLPAEQRNQVFQLQQMLRQ